MRNCRPLCWLAVIGIIELMTMTTITRVLAFYPTSTTSGWNRAISTRARPITKICGSSTLQKSALRNVPASIRTRTTTSVFSSSTEATRTLAPGSHMSEMEVKKSRFLGHAKHAENWAEAVAYIEEIKAEHPKARHWCYGFQCGVNPVSERCSDDGEPTGTAGLPILGTSVHCCW
jgi:hypothetical protein